VSVVAVLFSDPERPTKAEWMPNAGDFAEQPSRIKKRLGFGGVHERDSFMKSGNRLLCRSQVWFPLSEMVETRHFVPGVNCDSFHLAECRNREQALEA
jgi:hypothetical protein